MRWMVNTVLFILFTITCFSCSEKPKKPPSCEDLAVALETLDVGDRESVKTIAAIVKVMGTIGEKFLTARLENRELDALYGISERIKTYAIFNKLEIIDKLPKSFQAEFYTMKMYDKGYLSKKAPDWYYGGFFSFNIYEWRRGLRTAVFDLLPLGKSAIPFLIPLLDSTEGQVRYSADYGLRRLLQWHPHPYTEPLEEHRNLEYQGKWSEWFEENGPYLKWDKNHRLLRLDERAKSNGTPIDAESGEVLTGAKLNVINKESDRARTMYHKKWLWPIYGSKMK